jgi:hypothetical protein
MEQGRRKGNSMKGLPDSAILGTYGRMKHMNHKGRRNAKDYQATGEFLFFFICFCISLFIIL